MHGVGDIDGVNAALPLPEIMIAARRARSSQYTFFPARNEFPYFSFLQYDKNQRTFPSCSNRFTLDMDEDRCLQTIDAYFKYLLIIVDNDSFFFQNFVSSAL